VVNYLGPTKAHIGYLPWPSTKYDGQGEDLASSFSQSFSCINIRDDLILEETGE